MRIFRFVLSLVLLAGATAALAQKITVDYDHNANFQGYKTYAWAEGTPLKNQLWDQRVVDGVDQQLAAKGFQKVEESANPDLMVSYHAAIGQETQLNTMGMGGWRWGGGMATTTVDKIPTGQLVVDIGDAKTKRLLWMGKSSDTLAENSPDKNQKKLAKALQKMFQKFPPQPGKK
jgi:hypothetical protein